MLQKKYNAIKNVGLVSYEYLKVLGINEELLDSRVARQLNGFTNLFRHIEYQGSRWFIYDSLPQGLIEKYNLPRSNRRLIEELPRTTGIEKVEVEFVLKQAWSMEVIWRQYSPIYRDYFMDSKQSDLFARTHALFVEILAMKKRSIHSLNTSFKYYQLMTKAVFQTDSMAYFYKKLKKAEIIGIERALIHNFRLNGRSPYKVSHLIIKLIKKHYSNPKRYTQEKIKDKVNYDLIIRRMQPISRSSVQRVLKASEIRNQCDLVRYGLAYADLHILPSLHRSEPEFGELLEIDSTRIPIPYNLNNKVSYLWLCAVMEVYSRRIVGFSIDKSENVKMILKALQYALRTMMFCPIEILHDNHGAYSDKEYKLLKVYAEKEGISFRSSAVANAKDKSHIESWMGTFQTKYLKPIYGSYGEGITSKRVGGRATREQIQEFVKVKNLRSEEKLHGLLARQIEVYNNDIFQQFKENPNHRYERAYKTFIKNTR